MSSTCQVPQSSPDWPACRRWRVWLERRFTIYWEFGKPTGDALLRVPAVPALEAMGAALKALGTAEAARNTNEFRSGTMAQVCDICGKGPQFGNNISHAHNVTRRRWNVNLQAVKALVNGAPKRIRVCTSCIKAGKIAKA